MNWVSMKSLSLVVALLSLSFTCNLFSQDHASRTFNPNEIQILMDPDIDIVYHTLAYFNLPGDPSNLYSDTYIHQVRKAKSDLEVNKTKLDLWFSQLERSYLQFPRLRFLNLAVFMADDYASFKQALLMIDYKVEKEREEDSRETLEQRRAREGGSVLLFANAKRLIPRFQQRFPDPEERQFVKQFAECMDEEYNLFYKEYRETRAELDEQDFERFSQFWKAEGLRMVWPWAERSTVDVFKVFLSPVMRNNGRGVPVNLEQRVLLNIVAPLPESFEQTLNAFFVILHETTHRVTDNLVDMAATAFTEQVATNRENAVFYANYVYLKSRYPQYYLPYLKFSLTQPSLKPPDIAGLEDLFPKSYPLSLELKNSVEQALKKLQ